MNPYKKPPIGNQNNYKILQKFQAENVGGTGRPSTTKHFDNQMNSMRSFQNRPDFDDSEDDLNQRETKSR